MAGEASRQQMSVQLEGLELSFGLKGRRGGKKKILHGVSGVFRPGKLTAILGSSGAGKTTLLSAISGNFSEQIEGSISINGNRVKPQKMKRFSAFVFQEDLLFETSTVEESLQMSALLRLPPETTKKEAKQRADEMIDALMLGKCRGTAIGTTNGAGVSGGEKKRTAIGMEMITDPGILFLDEPTSGLDTFTAYAVVKRLQEIAREGRTVVSTIHQPASETFYLFDEVVLLAEGRVIYWGETGRVVAHFAKLGFKCPKYTNPADYFFMVLLSPDADEDAAGVAQERERRVLDIALAWSTHAKERGADTPARLPLRLEQGPRRASFWRQYSFLQGRALKNVFRNKRLLLIRLAQCIFNSLLAGIVFSEAGNAPPHSSARSLRGCLYFMVTNQIFGAAGATATVFSVEKKVFLKEYHGGYYAVLPYYISKVLSEVPAQLVVSTVMSLLLHWLVPLRKDAAGVALTTGFLCLASMNGFMLGFCVSAIFESPVYTSSVLPLVIFPLMLTGGIYGVTSKKIDWVKFVSPLRYAADSIIKNELDGKQIEGIDVSSVVLEGGYTFSNMLLNSAVLLAFFFFFMACGYVLLVLSTRRARQ